MKIVRASEIAEDGDVERIVSLIYEEKREFYDEIFNRGARSYLEKAFRENIPPYNKASCYVALDGEKIRGVLLYADKASFRHGYQKWLRVLGLKIFPVGMKMIYVIERLLSNFSLDDLYIVSLSGEMREFLLYNFIKKNRYRRVFVDASDEGFYKKLRFTKEAPIHPKLMRFDKFCDFDTLSGVGWDTHPLKSGRKLILGGVEIASELGLDGHSDADVLTHAIIDSLLGVCLRKDIGEVFPQDEKNRGRSSLEMLAEVLETINGLGYFPSSVDCVIISSVRLSTYRDQIRSKLESILNCPCSIKFKTGNGVYPESEFRGITAICVSNIEKI